MADVEPMVLRYTLSGILFGCVFPLISWFADIILLRLPLSLASVAHLHSTSTALWVIDFAPLVLGGFAYAIGVRQRALVEETGSLERRVRDRTHKLESSEARLRAVFERAAEGIVVFGYDGTIESINAAGARLFGRTAKELVGASLGTLLPDIAGDVDAWGVLSHTGKRLEVDGVRKDGTRVDLEIGLAALRGAKDFVGVLHDTTERKKVARMKDEFVSIVSHELRTPLTSIRGSLGLLEGGVAGELPKKASELVTIARGNADRLIRLINDMLDLDKIEAGKLDLTLARITPAEVVGGILVDMASLADQAGVELITELEEVSFRADKDRILQVLTNLVSNAIKFSSRGGRVTVRATRGNNIVRFEVIDEGKGIPKEDQPRLFGKFEQLDSSDTRVVGGSGLGLAITKRLVEQHEGRIGVTSSVGRGSTFFFELPLDAGPTTTPS